MAKPNDSGSERIAPPISELEIMEERTGDNIARLAVKINERGDLVLEGYDAGPAVVKWVGDYDYEYWRTVPLDYKDSVLLWLVKERFSSDLEYSEWLDEKGIPNKYENWV